MTLRVRLVMTVNEEDPSAGVREFVDALTLNGSRDWVYAVENVETEEPMGYFNGYGVPVDLDELMARQDQELEVRDPEEIHLPPLPEFDVTVDMTAGTGEGDDELLKLAEELNRQ